MLTVENKWLVKRSGPSVYHNTGLIFFFLSLAIFLLLLLLLYFYKLRILF